MKTNLDQLHAAYATDPAQLDPLLAACRVYAVRLAKHHGSADPEDVAQDAIIALWTSLDTFKGASSFATWFHSVVKNLRFHEYRNTQRHRHFEVASDAPPESLPDTDRATHFDMGTLDTRKQQIVIGLAFGDTLSEVAINLGISERHLRRIATSSPG